jgi:cell division septation protein DedD
MSSDIKPEEIRDALAEQRDLDFDDDPDERQSPLPPIADDAADEDWSRDFGRASIESQEPPAFGKMRRFVVPALVGCAAFLVMAAIALVAFKLFDNDDASRAIAVIEADSTPEKVKPEEPGGLDVPNQDNLLLNEPAETGKVKEVEQLLPPPEEPLARSDVEAAAAAQQAQQAQQSGGTAPLVSTETRQGLGGTAAEGATGGEQVAAAVPPTATAVPSEPVPAQFEGTPFAIQFASLRTMDKAQDMWRRLQARYPDLLGDMALNVDRVDLGDRGIFFRVQAGPVPNRATAEDMCGQLKARQQDCIVVAR